jgi:polysaccharide biosynthesis/export protein
MPSGAPGGGRGLTTFQLASEIARELKKQQYIKDPKVTVEVEAYRPFFILGEVRKPGQFPYVNAMTVEATVAWPRRSR